MRKVELIYTFKERIQDWEVVEIPESELETEEKFKAFLNIPPDTVKISMYVLLEEDDDENIPNWITECDGKLFF